MPSEHSRGADPRRATSFPRFLIVSTLLVMMFLGIAVMGSSGCGTGQKTVDESRAFAPQTAGDLTVNLRVSPYPPVPMQEAEFSISISDRQGRPVAGAEVSCDMTMPAMPMPPNRPKAAEQSPGVYTTPVMFTMAGEWEALIEVLPRDGAVNQFRFSMETR